jgi:hypothetical protein
MESSQSTYFPDDITNSDDQGTHDTSLSQQKSDTSSYHPKDDISITPIAMTLRTRSSLVNYDENISPLTEPKRVTTTTVPIREQMLDEPVILNTSPVGLARAERLNDERDEQLELTEGRLLNNLNIWDVTSLPARQKVQEALKRDVINNTLDNDNVNSNTTANKDTEFMVDPLTAYNLRLERISKTWRAESDEAARNGTLLKLDTSEAFMNNQEYHQLMFARNKEDESLSRLGMSRLARNGPALNEMTAAECESFKSAVEEELSMVTARALKPMGDGDDDGSSSSSSSEDDDSDSDRGNKKKKSSKKKSSKKKSSNSSRRSSDDDSRSISSFTETKSVSAKSTTSSKSRNVKAVLTTITERLVAKAENYETTAGIDGLIKNMKSILDTLKIDDGSGEKTDIDKHKRIQTLARKIGTFIDNSLSVFDVISVGIGKDIVNSNYDIQEALSTEHEKVETATETLNRLRLSHQNKPTTSRDYNRSQLELQFKPAYWDRKHQIEREVVRMTANKIDPARRQELITAGDKALKDLLDNFHETVDRECLLYENQKQLIEQLTRDRQRGITEVEKEIKRVNKMETLLSGINTLLLMIFNKLDTATNQNGPMQEIRNKLGVTVTLKASGIEITSPFFQNSLYGVIQNYYYYFMKTTLEGLIDFIRQESNILLQGHTMTTSAYTAEIQKLQYTKRELGYDAILETKAGQQFQFLVQAINAHPNPEIRDEVNKKLFHDISFLRDSSTDGIAFMKGIIESDIIEKTRDFLRQETERVSLMSSEKRRKYPPSNQSNATYQYSKKSGGSSYGTGSAYIGEEYEEEYAAPVAQRQQSHGSTQSNQLPAKAASQQRQGHQQTNQSSGYGGRGASQSQSSGSGGRGASQGQPPRATMSASTVVPPYDITQYKPTVYSHIECTATTPFKTTIGVEKNIWIRVIGQTGVANYRYTATTDACVKCASRDEREHHKGCRCFQHKCGRCHLYGHLATQCLND